MAKKSKSVESGQSEESSRGGATAEPVQDSPCAAVHQVTELPCVLTGPHEWHETVGGGVVWQEMNVSCEAPPLIPRLTNMGVESVRELSVPVEGDVPTAEPSIAEATAGVVVPPEGLVVPQMTSEHGLDFGEGRTECYIVRVTDGPCEMGWTESNGVRVAVAGHTSEAVQAMVARLRAPEVPGTARQVETLLARIAELEERLARQASSHREVRKRLLRKARVVR